MAGELIARTGVTRGGLPVSVNRAPTPELARHIARMFVTIVDQPDERWLEDFILNETGFLRVLVRGYWEARIEGEWRHFHDAVLFGAQSQPLRVRVRGPFATAGFAILPGAWRSLIGESATAMTDRLIAFGGPHGAALTAAAARIDAHDATFAALGAAATHWVAATPGTIEPIAEAFEAMSHVDPSRRIGDIAAAIGVTARTLDRNVLAGFGVGPKLVLRRSRFLDMAAVVRGLAVADQTALASLRFYDQSHRVREFRRFTGMTPLAFERTPTPLLTLGIESRQRRKLESTAAFGGRVPWLG